MIVTAILLVAVGVIASLLGTKLFKLLLPLIGLVTGSMVGFIGFQGVFGPGAVSTALAIVVALIVGLLFAIMSYIFFDLAVMFFFIALGAVAFSYLGVAIGLRDDGFVVFLLSLAGAILAGIYAGTHPLSLSLVVAATSMLGVAYILAGLMLIIGNVSLNDLHETGIVRTVLDVIDQSFIWFFVWIGGSLVAAQFQFRLAVATIMSDMYAFVEAPQNVKKK